jgi:site-specific recombinase XerC
MATVSHSRSVSMPLGQAIDEYLEWLELNRHRSLHTVRQYRADLDRFLAFAEDVQVRRTAALYGDLAGPRQSRLALHDRLEGSAGLSWLSPVSRSA